MAKPAATAKAQPCAECGEELDRTAVHAGCHDCGGDADDEPDMELLADELRRWATGQKTMGRLSPEVFAALEQAADDIAQGWPS